MPVSYKVFYMNSLGTYTYLHINSTFMLLKNLKITPINYDHFYTVNQTKA